MSRGEYESLTGVLVVIEKRAADLTPLVVMGGSITALLPPEALLVPESVAATIATVAPIAALEVDR